MDKPNRDDAKYAAGTNGQTQAEGQKKFDDDDYAYQRATSGPAARQGAVAGGLEANPNYTGGVHQAGGAVAPPVGDVSGKDLGARSVDGGPDPKDPKYAGLPGRAQYSRDRQAFEQAQADAKAKAAGARLKKMP